MDEPQHSIVSLPASTPTPNDAESTEDAMALEYATRYKDILRFEGYRNRWFKWTGWRWEVDHKMTAYALGRKLTRDIAVRLQDQTIKAALATLPNEAISKEKERARIHAKRSLRSLVKSIRSAKGIYAVVNLAKSDEKLSAELRQWDADPWKLNTPEGTVDLKTGAIAKHKARDYITKTCAVSPAWGEPTRWLAFLKEIFEGDEEMVAYMQRVLGYCITGVTIDHALFYAWGRGQNGKTTILETVGYVLGDYWIESPPQAFIAGSGERHETEIARMHNIRLVTSDELPQGKEWDTSKVKRLTGGSTISARFMRQDYFEFDPQFKLLMAGNDKPSLKQVDDAIRRRFNLIPFQYSVSNAKKDKDLPLKLKAEGPQILGWLIQGCLAWQSVGLNAPKRVREATDEYLSGEDNLSTWFDECCNRDEKSFASTTELYQSWCAWARANEEFPGSRKAFSQHLAGRAPILGIKKKKTNTAMGFEGVEILQAQKPIK